MVTLKDIKYKKIKNFFTQEELIFLKQYTQTRVLNRKYSLETQSPLAPSFYSDEVFDTYLVLKLKRMEEETGLKLFKTYAYWRQYIYGSILEDHIDRPSCEISCTVNIDQCEKEWPIHMDGTWLTMEPGDGVIYLGCEVEHGRKPFKGDFHTQVFMHYVDQNGPHAKWKDDGKC